MKYKKHNTSSPTSPRKIKENSSKETFVPPLSVYLYVKNHTKVLFFLFSFSFSLREEIILDLLFLFFLFLFCYFWESLLNSFFWKRGKEFFVFVFLLFFLAPQLLNSHSLYFSFFHCLLCLFSDQNILFFF